jgi:hypothetical protein
MATVTCSPGWTLSGVLVMTTPEADPMQSRKKADNITTRIKVGWNILEIISLIIILSSINIHESF